MQRTTLGVLLGRVYVWRSLVVSASLLCSTATAENNEVRLTQNQVDRAITVMKAELADAEAKATKNAPSVAIEQAKTVVLLQAMEGRIEPLAWFKGHSKHVATPPEAVYRPECSHDMTRQGVITAVFSFGLPAGGLGKMNLERNPKAFESFARGMSMMDEKGRAALQSTRQFYAVRQIRYEGNPEAYTHSFAVPDKTIKIAFMEVSPFGGGPCESLPTGPLIMIAAGSNEAALYGVSSPHEGAPASSEPQFEMALKKAALSGEEYRRILSNLKVAGQMALIPNFIEEMEVVQQEVGTDPNSPDLKPIWRNNIRIYKQNKGILDPLLEQHIHTASD